MKEDPPPPPKQIFKKNVHKNAVNPKLGDPPWQFFLKTLTPRDFSKNLSYPSMDFQPVCISNCSTIKRFAIHEFVLKLPSSILVEPSLSDIATATPTLFLAFYGPT